MLKILLKKQLYELNSSFFYDRKKGKARAKSTSILFIVLYALLMIVVIGGMFAAMSFMLCKPFVGLGLDWLYFDMMTLMALFLGVFGGVFCCWGCGWWTSRRPAQAGFRWRHRCCQCTHLSQKDRVHSQKTGDIHQDLQSLRRPHQPTESARCPSPRTHKREKRWQWQEYSTLSCALLFLRKIRWNLRNRQALSPFCFRLELHSLSLQSGS